MSSASSVPPVRHGRGRGRGRLLLAACILVCLLLVLVVVNIDRARAPATSPPLAHDDDVIELIEPGPLATDGRIGGAAPDLANAGDIVLDDGAWVRITDPQTQQIEQEYRWQRQNPNPPGKGSGWIEMIRPEARLYLSENRIATLEADSALAYMPGQGGLQSGDMTGNVVIRLFERQADGTISLDPRSASLQVLTAHAVFDNFTGEISADGLVEISTPTTEFTGSGLQIRLNDQKKDVQIAAAVERGNTVRLARAAAESRELSSEAQKSDGSANAAHDEMRARKERPGELTAQEQAGSREATNSPRPAGASRDSDLTSALNPGAAPAVDDATDNDDDESVQHYRLTMRDDVEVHDGSGETERVIAGDTLHLYFTQQSKGLSVEAATSPQRAGHREADQRHCEVPGHTPKNDGSHNDAPRPALSVNAMIAAVVTAAQESRSRPASLAPPAAPDDIVITCAGQLTIDPIDAKQAGLASPEDARLEILGSPVHVFDTATQVTVSCGKLAYGTSGEILEMLATPLVPLRFSSPQMTGEAARFWIVRQGEAAGFSGAGWLEFADTRRASGRRHVPGMTIVTAAAALALDPQLRLAVPPAHELPPGAAQSNRVRVEWTTNVDLDFFNAGTPDAQRGLRQAAFADNVLVLADEFAMGADSLIVGFTEPRAGGTSLRAGDAADPLQTDQSINRIDADGAVVIFGLNEAGFIACDALDLEFTANDAARPVPEWLFAAGHVQVSDPKQTMWSDTLHATFRRIEPDGASPALRGQRETTAARFGDVDVHVVTATGAVELLFGGGGRAFGDWLVADALEQTAELTGQNVLVAHDNLLIDRGRRIELDQRSGAARFDGAGTLTQVDVPLAMTLHPVPVYAGRLQTLAVRARQNVPVVAQRSATLPIPSGRTMLTTTWQDFAIFSGRANDGGGRAEFHGRVLAVAERTLLEYNSVSADDLELDFARQAIESQTGIAANEPAIPALDGGVSGSRVLHRFLARGNAALEHRAWPTEQRAQPPRIVAIHGEIVAYDAQTGEALIDGPGRMVVQDLGDAAATGSDAAADNEAAGPTPFSNDGISRFRWARSLRMTRNADGTSLVALDGEVALEHLSLADELSTLAADRVEVTLDGEAEPLETAALGLSGAASLRSMVAIGSVFVRSGDREIDCARLEYDESSKVANIHGSARDPALVRQRGSTNALRMLEGRWNTRTNAVTIIQGTAGGGR